jgi:glutamine---fructose-6-phosphate transaminase (isomerizing)
MIAYSRRQCRTCRRWRRGGGRIILITDPRGAQEATINSLVTMTVPEMPVIVTPLVYAIPVQLIAYHTAVIMGTDVDQPRNLAKSVTVE